MRNGERHRLHSEFRIPNSPFRMSQGFEFFEHTADVGLRVWGHTREELLTCAAQGLVALIAEESVFAERETRRVALRAASVEALLRAWLTQLLAWFDADGFLPAAYALRSPDETTLEGEVRGERFDPARHAAGVEAKGVTRLQFHVEQRDGMWHAQLIVDV